MPKPGPEPARRRVLFVDDEAALVDLATHALARVGYEVVPAYSGLQALDTLQREADALDAIVLDLVLPDIGGGELIERMRSINASIPIVVSSGLDREQALRVAPGMTAFLHKPYAPSDLRATLDAVTADST